MISQFPPLLVESPIVINTGQTQTTLSFDLIGTSLVGLKMPPIFDGTALTLQVAMQQNDTFLDFYQLSAGATTLVTIPVAANRFINLDAQCFVSAKWIKLTSDVVQAQDSIIFLISRPV